jgi:hypothetical protein
MDVQKDVLPAAELIPNNLGFVIVVLSEEKEIAYLSNLIDPNTVKATLNMVINQIKMDAGRKNPLHVH